MPALLAVRQAEDSYLFIVDRAKDMIISGGEHIYRAVSATFDADVPYVVALIELEEGPVMMTNVIDCDPETLEIGQGVRVTFEPRGHELAVPQFKPEV